MRLFSCGHCGQRLFFENTTCEHCDAVLGFLPDKLSLVSLDPANNGLWKPLNSDLLYKKCKNYEGHAVCNWMIPEDDLHEFCSACGLNQTIPDLSIDGNIDLWRALETEKRRLVYSLLRLNLPIEPLSEVADGLAFDFLADTEHPFSERGKVLTGHANGLITINIKEADPAEREKMRGQLDEPYRTLLGHFRHESGHYYWNKLIQNTDWLTECRDLFGDETLDYGKALENHYQQGAPENWQENFITGYATMHPWEDWTETWAHYLHIVDTLETAWQYSLGIRPKTGEDVTGLVKHDFDAYKADSIELLIEHWLPLTYVLNSLNRSMGHEHAYPFVISPQVIKKLDFIHRVTTH